MALARLLILAEERLLGRGLATLFEPRFETHSIESFKRAARLLGSDRAEIALWLGDRLDAAAVEELEHLKRGHPALRLCLIARAADAEALRSLLRRHPVGVAVLIRSDELDVREVLASLDRILDGRSTFAASVLERLVDAQSRRHDAISELTPTEQEVLELVAQGLRNGEIARRIWKSEKAVEKQVSRVFEKLGLDQRSAPHLDRRVTAARIFLTCRPQSIEASESMVPAPLP
jgi:DNA-binding NarL/FixJ family response regulator